MSYDRAALAKIEDHYEEFETGSDGLLDQEAKRRLLKVGLNVCQKARSLV